MYQDPQETERLRRDKVAKQQEHERKLKDSTKKRETRYCNAPGCGGPFWCPPGSIRTKCGRHEGKL